MITPEINRFFFVKEKNNDKGLKSVQSHCRYILQNGVILACGSTWRLHEGNRNIWR
jgi:hypothetical protein